jgi:hypothetical protein
MSASPQTVPMPTAAPRSGPSGAGPALAAVTGIVHVLLITAGVIVAIGAIGVVNVLA